jgi:hypothetical protein
MDELKQLLIHNATKVVLSKEALGLLKYIIIANLIDAKGPLIFSNCE